MYVGDTGGGESFDCSQKAGEPVSQACDAKKKEEKEEKERKREKSSHGKEQSVRKGRGRARWKGERLLWLVVRPPYFLFVIPSSVRWRLTGKIEIPCARERRTVVSLFRNFP